MDYRSIVNPTYLTAKSTILMLAKSGNEDAQKIVDLLHIESELAKNNQKTNPNPITFSKADHKALMHGVTVAIESRYETINHFAIKENYHNLLDIACGYTPRALFCQKNNIDYVGVDVPVVVDELQKISDAFITNPRHKTYIGGDATNEASLKEASDLLKGKVVISSEGLLQYLSSDETEQFLEGIRNILLEHEGVWITSDFAVNYDEFAVANMTGPHASELFIQARKQSIGASNIYFNGVALWDEDKKYEFITSHGFIIEKIPFYSDDMSLKLLNNIPEGWKSNLLNLLNSLKLWKMSVDPNYKKQPEIKGAKSVDNLKINFIKRGSSLNINVHGRVDTLSSPALLEIIETNSKNVHNINIDAKELDYISSAGLRVIMIAASKIDPNKILIKNANSNIIDIFEMTGFNRLVDFK